MFLSPGCGKYLHLLYHQAMISGLKTTVGRDSHHCIIPSLGRLYRTHRAVLAGISIGSLYSCCIANYHPMSYLLRLKLSWQIASKKFVIMFGNVVSKYGLCLVFLWVIPEPMCAFGAMARARCCTVRNTALSAWSDQTHCSI